METYKELYRKAILKSAFERKLNEYISKPLLRRLLSRKPKDPVPGQSMEDTLYVFIMAARLELAPNGVRYREDEHESMCISMNICWTTDEKTNDGFAIVVNCRFNDGACFHEERKSIRRGSVSELGIKYPYSECGVTGLPAPADLPDWARPTEAAFRKAVDLMRELTCERA